MGASSAGSVTRFCTWQKSRLDRAVKTGRSKTDRRAEGVREIADHAPAEIAAVTVADAPAAIVVIATAAVDLKVRLKSTSTNS